jgi:putative PIN family toxin of toxin-antitoxin system
VKVVIDTKVFISSFFDTAGAPRKIIELWKRGEIVLCVSDEIITEYINVLLRLGLKGEEEIAELLELLNRKVNIVFASTDQTSQLIIADPGNDKFVACAVVAHADILISVEKYLLDLKEYKHVKIVTPLEFIEQVKRSKKSKVKSQK